MALTMQPVTRSWNDREKAWAQSTGNALPASRPTGGLAALGSYKTWASSQQSKPRHSGSGTGTVNYSAPAASSIYKAPKHPSDYGLGGSLPPVDVSPYLLDPWENVEAPGESPYMDMYKDWSETGYINREVQPEDTVAWQMDKLLDEQSPYITQARQTGKEYAASRGLLNSSMGAQASQRAAIESALPIAQQDASTYFSQGINNQNLANQFALARQNAGMQGVMEMDRLKQTLDAEFARFNAEMDLKTESYNSTMGFEAVMTNRQQNEARKMALADLWFAGDQLEVNTALTLEGLEANVAVANAEIASKIAMQNAAIAANARTNYLNGLLQINTGSGTPEQQIAASDMWKTYYQTMPSYITNYAAMYA